MRLLLVGAFPYPHHQGSQVYLQEQAIALRAAGVDVELLTYGRREGLGPDGDLERWRALDGFVHHTVPRALRPRSLASGPGLAKPAADAALARALRNAVASKSRGGASFDAILAHNLEACVISLGARVIPGQAMPPIVYCVHTLMRHELSSYLKLLKNKGNSGDPSEEGSMRRRVKRVIDGGGGSLDRVVARRADGWIALTQSAARVMRQHSTRPGDVIPPPLPDPRHRFFDDEPLPPLPGDPFFLYTGNLDGYQELQLLDGAARILAAEDEKAPRIVVASFDPAVQASRRPTGPGIEPWLVSTEAEMQALIAGARATIVTRRAEGGFPIKLVNSLAQGTPALTLHDREWGLSDGVEVRVVDRVRTSEGIARAIRELAADPGRARAMGERARARYEAVHRPAAVAERTLALVAAVRAARERAGAGG